MKVKDVQIKIIPHDQQRYETCGDWWVDEEHILQIRVSDTGNWIYNQLIAFHEYAEALMCIQQGIPEEDVTQFDIKFEIMREKYPAVVGDSEPGDMVSAPYHKQHCKATHLESLLCQALDTDWKKYTRRVNGL